MRSPAEKLRWILLGGGVLLACVLAAIFGMANYRAGQIWRRILARNGVNLKQETNGFTYSQSDGKRTIFTLHAAKAKPQGNDRWSLSDAVLVLYAKDGRTDRIYGSQFDYDQKAGVARALGEVHMDLQAPAATGQTAHEPPPTDLGFAPGADDTQDGMLIHVRTSGLVYMRKLGVAATPEMTEFRYRGMTCISHGAEFDSGMNILRLLADVSMDGVLRGSPFHLTAAHADLDRSANTTDLTSPTLLSENRRSSANHALLHLRPSGSVATAEADGNVRLQADTQVVSAPLMQGTFSKDNRPQHALLSGGVRFADTDAQQPSQGTANTLELLLNEAGLLRTAIADGGVDFTERVAKDPATSRELHSRKAVASFIPATLNAKRSALQTLHMTGSAVLLGNTPAKVEGDAPALTRVEADDLTTTFTAAGRRPLPSLLAGSGHTQLEQRGEDGQHQVSTGEFLEVHLSQRLEASDAKGKTPMEVQSATQTGHVVLHSWASKSSHLTAERKPLVAPSASREGSLTVGHADKATYEGAEGILKLTSEGGARAEVYDGSTQIAAPTIVLHQATGDGEASGGVVATTSGQGGDTATTHVLAARATLLHDAGISQFFGTDSQPARLWQAGSQVQAAKLVLDGQHHGLSARPESKAGRVHAIFANAHPAIAGQGEVQPASRPAKTGGQPIGGTLPAGSRDALEVQAATMDYNDTNREATFGGGVRVQDSGGDVTGEHGAAFLTPVGVEKPAGVAEVPGAGFGGKLDRFVILGDVRMAQPGRTGTGEQLTYTATTNNFVLTGSGANLPRIHDTQQGVVTGPTLVYGAADSSIVVAGISSSNTAAARLTKPARVHTETDLKQP